MSIKIKKVLRKVGIVIIILLVLSWGHSVYVSTGDYIIYSIKTAGQTKHKLTVHVKREFTGTPREHTSIEVIQKIGPVRDISSAEKEITYRETDKNGIVIFYLLPGIYYCQGKGNLSGYTDFINLDSDKEIIIEIGVPLGQ